MRRGWALLAALLLSAATPAWAVTGANVVLVRNGQVLLNITSQTTNGVVFFDGASTVTSTAAATTGVLLGRSPPVFGTAVVGDGGTGLTTGTSGGILGFTGTTTLASSALLTANQVLFGGGAGFTPATENGTGAGALTWNPTSNVLMIGTTTVPTGGAVFQVNGSSFLPTVYGSESSAGNLTLQSTTHATKGMVILADAFDAKNPSNELWLTDSDTFSAADGGSATVVTGHFRDQLVNNQTDTTATIVSPANASCTGANAPYLCCSGAGTGTCLVMANPSFVFRAEPNSSGSSMVVAATTDESVVSLQSSGALLVVASAPTVGGTGYMLNDVLTLTSGTGTVTATGVSGGIVTAVTLTTAGVDNHTGAGQPTTGGTGTGCTINVTSVVALQNANIHSSGTAWYVSVLLRASGPIPSDITVEALYEDGAGNPAAGTWRTLASTTTNTRRMFVAAATTTGITTPFTIWGYRVTLGDWTATGTAYLLSAGLHHGSEEPWPAYARREMGSLTSLLGGVVWADRLGALNNLQGPADQPLVLRSGLAQTLVLRTNTTAGTADATLLGPDANFSTGRLGIGQAAPTAPLEIAFTQTAVGGVNGILDAVVVNPAGSNAQTNRAFFGSISVPSANAQNFTASPGVVGGRYSVTFSGTGALTEATGLDVLGNVAATATTAFTTLEGAMIEARNNSGAVGTNTRMTGALILASNQAAAGTLTTGVGVMALMGSTAGTTTNLRALEVGGTDNKGVNRLTGGTVPNAQMVFIQGFPTATTAFTTAEQLRLDTSALAGTIGLRQLGTLNTHNRINGNTAFGTDQTPTAVVHIVPVAGSGTVVPDLRVTGPANASLTAAERVSVDIDLGPTQSWGSGAIASQRAMLLRAPTLSGSAPTAVFTEAASFAITGAPIVSGGNATLADTYGLWIQSVAVGAATRSTALRVLAQTGAATNYASTFTGGNVGIGDTTPTSLLTVGSGDLFQINATGDIRRINNFPTEGTNIVVAAAALVHAACGGL